MVSYASSQQLAPVACLFVSGLIYFNLTLKDLNMNDTINTPTIDANGGAVAVRITSKALSHPDSKQLLRTGFAPVDLTWSCPALALEPQLAALAGALLANAAKQSVQATERGAWVGGATPFNPAMPGEVTDYLQSLLNKVGIEALHLEHCTTATRAASATRFGAKAWKLWLADSFIPALQAYYLDAGKEELSAHKVAASIAIMGQGRAMSDAQLASFVTRFTAMCDSPNSVVQEALLGATGQSAFNWLTAATVEATATELEI